MIFLFKGRYSLKKKTLNNGFTLVELLSVIAIIGILVSIMLPALRGAREKSFQSTCLSHLQQIGYGEFMYAMDNNDYFPDKYTLGGFPFRAAPGYRNPNDKYGYEETFGLAAVLDKYLKTSSSNELWVCSGQTQSWMRELGNTYWASIESTSFTNVRDAGETAIAGDNYVYKPYTPGVRANGYEPGFLSDGNASYDRFFIDEDERYQPHSFGVGSKGGASVLYADCHASSLKEE